MPQMRNFTWMTQIKISVLMCVNVNITIPPVSLGRLLVGDCSDIELVRGGNIRQWNSLSGQVCGSIRTILRNRRNAFRRLGCYQDVP